MKYEIAIGRPDGRMETEWAVTIHDAKGFSSAWITDNLRLVMQSMAINGWDFKGQIEDNGEKVLIWQREYTED